MSMRTANAKSSLGFAKVVRNRYPIVYELDKGSERNLTKLVRSKHENIYR